MFNNCFALKPLQKKVQGLREELYAFIEDIFSVSDLNLGIFVPVRGETVI